LGEDLVQEKCTIEVPPPGEKMAHEGDDIEIVKLGKGKQQQFSSPPRASGLNPAAKAFTPNSDEARMSPTPV